MPGWVRSRDRSGPWPNARTRVPTRDVPFDPRESRTQISSERRRAACAEKPPGGRPGEGPDLRRAHSRSKCRSKGCNTARNTLPPSSNAGGDNPMSHRGRRSLTQRTDSGGAWEVFLSSWGCTATRGRTPPSWRTGGPPAHFRRFRWRETNRVNIGTRSVEGRSASGGAVAAPATHRREYARRLR
jgi:hypothetical protein